MKKEKKTLLKFMELPKELTTFFLLRAFLIFLGLIGVILFGIFSQMLKATLVIGGFLLIYSVYQGYTYYSVVSQKILVYKGIFEKKDVNSIDIKKPIGKGSLLSYHGPCNIILQSESNPSIKMQVPVGYGFQVSEGNQVSVYSRENEVYKKNENTYSFENPMLVKVTKT